MASADDTARARSGAGRLRTAGVLALVFAAGAAFALVGDRLWEAETPEPVAPAMAVRVADALAQGAPERGSEDAPVEVVVWTDFHCPFCLRAQRALERVVAEQPGAVRVSFRHLPRESRSGSELAHRAAVAAGLQGQFWEMHDRIFEHPRARGRAALIEHARALGLDVVRFQRDLDGEQTGAVVARDLHEALEKGVEVRPTFFINGRVAPGAHPYQTFKLLIDRELQRVASADAGDSGPPDLKTIQGWRKVTQPSS